MITIDYGRCDTCGTCVGVCPVDALAIVLEQLTFDEHECMHCEACVLVCPVKALSGGND